MPKTTFPSTTETYSNQTSAPSADASGLKSYLPLSLNFEYFGAFCILESGTWALSGWLSRMPRWQILIFCIGLALRHVCSFPLWVYHFSPPPNNKKDL